jgi:diguanylate cyclase (GGDEF)-like protein/PAS domain S-box-containing protein
MGKAMPEVQPEFCSSLEEINILRNRISELEMENSDLREYCQCLNEAQEGLEVVLGETNAKLLEGEMLAMELGQVFSASSDATCVVRDDDLVVRANDAMLKFLAKQEQEVIGQNVHDLLDKNLGQEASSKLYSALKTCSSQEYDMERQNGEGETEYYIVSALPLITIDGSKGIVAQFKDITMRQRAENSLAQAKDELEMLARVDGLTQLFNRRTFDESLLKEWKRMSRENKSLSLILCDIDYFKKYNDHYGHQEGDDCLRKVAQALATCVKRPADLVARYGGEEFVLLLPDTPLEGAKVIAEGARKAVEEQGVAHVASDIAPVVTLSLGVACIVPHTEEDPHAFIRAADEALYRAKEQGRNRFVSG